jgi:hypothetical protein
MIEEIVVGFKAENGTFVGSKMATVMRYSASPHPY